MNKKLISGVFLAAGLLFSSSTVTTFAATPYTVKPGDTLWKISKSTGVSTRNIATYNNLSNPNALNYGEKLQIPTSSDLKRQRVVNYAKSFLGKVPYVYGGSTPAGFDCSGFVEYVFAKEGITLPRVSSDQAKVGTYVPASKLKVGDLVFLADTSSTAANRLDGVTHVAIWLGHDSMIESSSAKNNVIIVNNVWLNPYYKAHYWGARNVIGN